MARRALFTRAVIATVFLTAGLLGTGLLRVAVFAGAVITGAVITGAIFAGRFVTGPVITGPIVTRTVIAAAFVAAVVIAAIVVTAGLLRARGLGQFDKRVFVLIHNGKAAGVGLVRLGLIATRFGAVFAFRTVVALTIAVAIAIAGLLLLTLFLFGGHLTLRFGKQAGIMLGVLQEILGSNTVIRQLRVAGEHLVFFDDLLRRSTHLAFGARAVEDTVDDIAEGARAVRLRTRTRLGRAHLYL
jgi:hypothetical protein